MTDWFETERLWEVSHDFLFPESRLRETDAEVEKILTLVGTPRHDALDLVAGRGARPFLSRSAACA